MRIRPLCTTHFTPVRLFKRKVFSSDDAQEAFGVIARERACASMLYVNRCIDRRTIEYAGRILPHARVQRLRLYV